MDTAAGGTDPCRAQEEGIYLVWPPGQDFKHLPSAQHLSVLPYVFVFSFLVLFTRFGMRRGNRGTEGFAVVTQNWSP